MSDETERLAVVETEVRNLKDEVQELKHEVAENTKATQELREVLAQTQGARAAAKYLIGLILTGLSTAAAYFGLDWWVKH